MTSLRVKCSNSNNSKILILKWTVALKCVATAHCIQWQQPKYTHCQIKSVLPSNKNIFKQNIGVSKGTLNILLPSFIGTSFLFRSSIREQMMVVAVVPNRGSFICHLLNLLVTAAEMKINLNVWKERKDAAQNLWCFSSSLGCLFFFFFSWSHWSSWTKKKMCDQISLVSSLVVVNRYKIQSK